MTKKETIKKYFKQGKKLKISNPTYKKQVKFLTDWFLVEDLGDKGDITSDLVIKYNSPATAIITAKENGIIAGLEEIVWLLSIFHIQYSIFKKDGSKVKCGDKIIQLTGKIKTILKLERTVLNLLQRMSGIATQTSKLVKKNGPLICPTRKTQWGLLDKKAVVLGGGGTHRLGLHDWILIKDNHIQVMLSEARRAKSKHPLLQQGDPSTTFSRLPLVHSAQDDDSFYEIESKTEQQVWEFLGLKPGAIMLDNMTPKQIEKLVPQIRKINPNIILEASGGINETNIYEYTKTGVDIISIGAVTHSVRALDISLDIK